MIRRIVVPIFLMSFVGLFVYAFGADSGKEVVRLPLELQDVTTAENQTIPGTDIPAQTYQIKPLTFPLPENTQEKVIGYINAYGVGINHNKRLGELKVNTKQRNYMHNVLFQLNENEAAILTVDDDKYKRIGSASVPLFMEIEEGLGRSRKQLLIGEFEASKDSSYMFSGQFMVSWDMSDPDAKMFFVVKSGGYILDPKIFYSLIGVIILSAILCGITHPSNKRKGLKFRRRRR